MKQNVEDKTTNAHIMVNGSYTEKPQHFSDPVLTEEKQSLILSAKVLIAALAAISIVCVLVFGVVSIIFAARGFRDEKQGNVKSAKRYLRASLVISVASIAVATFRLIEMLK